MAIRAKADQIEPDTIEEQIRLGHYRQAVIGCAEQHADSIGRLCMALLGDRTEAEDTIQEVLIAAFDAMPSYRGDGSVKAWLLGIARKKCARKLETRTRRAGKLHLVHDAEHGSDLTDELVQSRRTAQLMRSALDELKPSEREPVLLRYQSGLTYREIGSICNIDEAAARKRVSRALDRLRSLLKPVLDEQMRLGHE